MTLAPDRAVDAVDAAPPAPRRPARVRDRQVSDYTELARQVRLSGLMERNIRSYVLRFSSLVLAFGAVLAAAVLIGQSWWQLALAAVVGILLTQVAYLGHDAAHHQIFASPRKNERASIVISALFVGLSHGWWMQKHSAHHANPNKVDSDPDIAPDFIVFTPEDGAASQAKGGIGAWIHARQGYLFFPVLTLEGANLHRAALKHVLSKQPVPTRKIEITFLAIRLLTPVVVLLAVFPLGMAAAILGVQLAVFGLFMGGTFVPNHTGMPIVPPDARIDFLRRQTLMSRNIRGGRGMDLLMGGLNLQVEHHLFPSMPRANLRKVKPMVVAHCEAKGVQYTETGLFESFGIVIRFLNASGLGARDPFQCPLTAQLRSAR